MIGYLEGEVIKKEDDRVLLLVNHVGYEVILPAYVMGMLENADDSKPVSFYIYYHQTERQPKPVLIGFNLEAEKEFFQYFISVEAIGPMKAVKAMTVPAREIARFIEDGDVTALTRLNGIGKRTAQKIIATLEGKMGSFTLGDTGEATPSAKPMTDDISTLVFDALVSQLGYRPLEARKMIQEAYDRNPDIDSPEMLFDEVYRGQG